MLVRCCAGSWLITFALFSALALVGCQSEAGRLRPNPRIVEWGWGPTAFSDESRWSLFCNFRLIRPGMDYAIVLGEVGGPKLVYNGHILIYELERDRIGFVSVRNGRVESAVILDGLGHLLWEAVPWPGEEPSTQPAR